MLNWLIGLEYKAFKAYQDAARFFAHDLALSRMLKNLSRDELLHYYALRTAEAHLDLSIAIRPAVTIDEALRKEIERPFSEFSARLDAGQLSREELLTSAVKIEFSEFNHIFSYIVNTLKDSTKEFNALEENITHHREDLEEYISNLPEAVEILKKLDKLPTVNRKKILVVEDNIADANLLKGILEQSANVELAENGKEALSMILKKKYDVIISDIEMPEMDGTELYLRSTAQDEKIKDSFMFYTARNTPETLSFFNENKVRHLFKPAPISEIRATVKNILESNA